MNNDDLKPGDGLTLTERSNGHQTRAIVTDAGGCAIPPPHRPVPMAGRMPHDIAEARKDVMVSKASSRRELARIVVSEIIPALQQLGHNDRVTQEAIKSLIAGVQAQGEELLRIAARQTACETMSFSARLRWAFTFSPKKDA